MGKNNDRYVVKHDDGWAVKKSGADHASSIHHTQREAEQAAKEIVSNRGGGERFAFRAVSATGATRIPCRPETIPCRPATASTESGALISDTERRFLRVSETLSMLFRRYAPRSPSGTQRRLRPAFSSKTVCKMLLPLFSVMPRGYTLDFHQHRLRAGMPSRI